MADIRHDTVNKTAMSLPDGVCSLVVVFPATELDPLVNLEINLVNYNLFFPSIWRLLLSCIYSLTESYLIITLLLLIIYRKYYRIKLLELYAPMCILGHNIECVSYKVCSKKKFDKHQPGTYILLSPERGKQSCEGQE